MLRLERVEGVWKLQKRGQTVGQRKGSTRLSKLQTEEAGFLGAPGGPPSLMMGEVLPILWQWWLCLFRWLLSFFCLSIIFSSFHCYVPLIASFPSSSPFLSSFPAHCLGLRLAAGGPWSQPCLKYLEEFSGESLSSQESWCLLNICGANWTLMCIGYLSFPFIFSYTHVLPFNYIISF